MQSKTLINFSCSTEKKAQYTAACSSLGVSVSDVCRRALDNAISLAEKLKTPAPARAAIMGKVITDKRALDKLAYEKSLGGEP